MALQGHERKLLRFLASHLAIGFIAAILFEALLVFTDSFGLKAMVLQGEDGFVAGILLFFGLFITFGSAAMGEAIWQLGEERDGDHA